MNHASIGINGLGAYSGGVGLQIIESKVRTILSTFRKITPLGQRIYAFAKRGTGVLT